MTTPDLWSTTSLIWQASETPPLPIPVTPEREPAARVIVSPGVEATSSGWSVFLGAVLASSPQFTTLAAKWGSTGAVEAMRTEIEQLKARVSALEEEVERLRALGGASEVIMLRTISKEEAKQEIRALFEAGGTWYYSDIAKHLRLELSEVVELCQELEQEGDIWVDANAI